MISSNIIRTLRNLVSKGDDKTLFSFLDSKELAADKSELINGNSRMMGLFLWSAKRPKASTILQKFLKMDDVEVDTKYDSKSALHLTIENNCLESFKILLRFTDLTRSIIEKDRATEINIFHTLSNQPKEEYTNLLIGFINKNIGFNQGFVKDMLLPPHCKNGVTPLHLAAMNSPIILKKFIDLLKFFEISPDEYINITTNANQTLLHYSALEKSGENAKLLLKLGADQAILNSYARTAEQEAYEYDETSFAYKFLHHSLLHIMEDKVLSESDKFKASKPELDTAVITGALIGGVAAGLFSPISYKKDDETLSKILKTSLLIFGGAAIGVTIANLLVKHHQKEAEKPCLRVSSIFDDDEDVDEPVDADIVEAFNARLPLAGAEDSDIGGSAVAYG